MKVPIVSKTSDKLKAKIVIKTIGKREISPNSEGNPAAEKITKNVSSKAAKALATEFPAQSIEPKSTSTHPAQAPGTGTN